MNDDNIGLGALLEEDELPLTQPTIPAMRVGLDETLEDEDFDEETSPPPRKKRKIDAWRRFWGTLNNPTVEETRLLKSYIETDAYKLVGLSGIILQTEKGENTGTKHFQIYCEITKGSKMSSRQIHKIPGFARLAVKKPPRSTRKAVEYCRKQQTRVEGLRGFNGTFRGYRDSPDQQEIFNKIYSGNMTTKKISTIDPMLFLRAHTGLQKMIGLHQKHRDFLPKIIFYVGPTGCGKSIKMFDKYPGAYPFSWPKGGTMWMDNYHGGNSEGTGHDVIVFDEFTSSRIKCHLLMDILSAKPFPVQFKGGFTTLNSHTLVFTTNEEPMDFYPGITAVAFAMLRRRIIQFAEIFDFTRPDGPHWREVYNRPRLPIQQMLSEIQCTRRTVLKARTVGPDLQDYGNMNIIRYPERYPQMTGIRRRRGESPPVIDM